MIWSHLVWAAVRHRVPGRGPVKQTENSTPGYWAANPVAVEALTLERPLFVYGRGLQLLWQVKNLVYGLGKQGLDIFLNFNLLPLAVFTVDPIPSLTVLDTRQGDRDLLGFSTASTRKFFNSRKREKSSPQVEDVVPLVILASG